MSSISLPRILQTRKSSDDLEKEQYDKLLVNIFVSINLAHCHSALPRIASTAGAVDAPQKSLDYQVSSTLLSFKTQIADAFAQAVDSQFSGDRSPVVLPRHHDTIKVRRCLVQLLSNVMQNVLS